jgi:exodeoxyribonuclease VII large subunit
MNPRHQHSEYISPSTAPQRKILSVSQLTQNIKSILEDSFPFVWVSGEISNFRMPVSGHFYFTLKDETAQINSVMFRGQNRNLKFQPEDGMIITGLGRISVYEPRGTYQIIFEYFEPQGIGAIQIAFEQLKARLAEEGLFEEKFKKPLPFLPRKICILTSPTGAAVHDMLRIITLRFPNLLINILPVRVQGENADIEIESAVRLLNTFSDVDLAILARGGGSLEDLYPFNSERVARAIFDCNIPIISAIGHETDFTIADFVADLRAPTPSAAAELAVPVKTDLLFKIDETSNHLVKVFKRYHEQLHNRVKIMTKRLIDPKKRIQELMLRTDDLSDRLLKMFNHTLSRKREQINWRRDRLQANNPIATIQKFHDKLKLIGNNLLTYLNIIIMNKTARLEQLSGRLDELSPKNILSRGYSITRVLPEYIILKDTKNVEIRQDIEVIVHRGSLTAKVLDKKGKHPALKNGATR